MKMNTVYTTSTRSSRAGWLLSLPEFPSQPVGWLVLGA